MRECHLAAKVVHGDEGRVALVSEGRDHEPVTRLSGTELMDAAKLVGVDYRTIKFGLESGTIPAVQLGPRRMSPRVPQLRVRRRHLILGRRAELAARNRPTGGRDAQARSE